jgi:hypothetical protein
VPHPEDRDRIVAEAEARIAGERPFDFEHVTELKLAQEAQRRQEEEREPERARYESELRRQLAEKLSQSAHDELRVQFIDARDTATWLITSAERGVGGVYNVAGPQAS